MRGWGGVMEGMGRSNGGDGEEERLRELIPLLPW